MRQGAPAPGEVADLCSQARTFEALQYVLLGLGGVAIGTGAVILVTDSSGDAPEKDHRPEEALRPRPRVAVGRSSAEVGLSLNF